MRRWTIRSIVLTFVVLCILTWQMPMAAWLFVPFAALSAVAITDMLQTRHAIRRNFPLVGHFRYLFESIRPEINQYFIESNTDGAPFNRETRSVIYQRAKSQRDSLPFGTRHDVYATGYECIRHSLAPVTTTSAALRLVIGGPDCRKPYEASLLNISAMSYGALSGRAIEALNEGARLGGFAHNTGEGGISRYHLKHGGDLIWQIGTGYFGCRDAQGQFDPQAFERNATLPNVKMIELKLSQGAKPSLGGLLPAAKVTADIAEARGVPIGKSVVSPARHTAFGDFDELCKFIAKLRKLSDGKPVGIKLCVGMPEELDELCAAMVRTGISPDFITVDGAEGGTGAASLEFTNHVGTPLYEALVMVGQALQRHHLRHNIKVICSGKIATGFDVVRALALGADGCASARGMMLALGCIQALRCDSNKCPAGIATQDAALAGGLIVPEKSQRVARFHQKTLDAAATLLGAMGRSSPSEVTPHHVLRRTSDGSLKTLAQIYSVDALRAAPLHEVKRSGE